MAHEGPQKRPMLTVVFLAVLMLAVGAGFGAALARSEPVPRAAASSAMFCPDAAETERQYVTSAPDLGC